MKLSEAIRLGAMMKPQAFEDYLDEGNTCAMGAALDAIGQLDSDHCDSEYFPLVDVAVTRCPICRLRTAAGNVSSTIFHLNDDHKWTRERIADWVATIEAKEVAAQPEPVNVLVQS